jgi:hypothetical protein
MAMPLAFEHKSSIETKLAPRLVRIAVGSDPGSTDMSRLQREWILKHHSAGEQIAIHPKGISRRIARPQTLARAQPFCHGADWTAVQPDFLENGRL